MIQGLKRWFPWTLAALCLISALWSWYHPKEVERVRTEYQERTRIVYVKVPVKIPSGEVQGTGETVQSNPVIATADCPPSSNGSDIVTTITPSTGEAHILVKPKSPDLFAFEDQKEIGVRYNGVRAGMFGRWTFVRVGNLYGALYAEANTKPDAQVMAELSYRW